LDQKESRLRRERRFRFHAFRLERLLLEADLPHAAVHWHSVGLRIIIGHQKVLLTRARRRDNPLTIPHEDCSGKSAARAAPTSRFQVPPRNRLCRLAGKTPLLKTGRWLARSPASRACSRHTGEMAHRVQFPAKRRFVQEPRWSRRACGSRPPELGKATFAADRGVF